MKEGKINVLILIIILLVVLILGIVVGYVISQNIEAIEEKTDKVEAKELYKNEKINQNKEAMTECMPQPMQKLFV